MLRRACRWRILPALLLGAILSIAVALAAAAIRPTDGWPNAFGIPRDQYEEHYKLPQFRLRTPDGDVFVDVHGGWAHTEVDASPAWKRVIRPEDQWIFSTYPYPENISLQELELFHHPARFDLPYWASRWTTDPRERAVISSAWGWPLRCLRGTERSFGDWSSDGSKWLNRSVETTSFYTHGSGSVGARFRRIPYGIIAPGLLANTTFFAAILWMLMFSFIHLRGFVRSRRNLCSRCAYNRQGLPADAPCPECGNR
jgi:hypothetical protein